MQRHIYPLGWGWFDWQIESISKKVRAPVSGVFGVPRGGLVPAVALSHRLGVPFLDAPNDSMLWIDDIVDSGRTLAYWRDKFPGATYAALIGPPDRKDPLTGADGLIIGTSNFPGSWWVFPWESLSKAREDMAVYMAKEDVT